MKKLLSHSEKVGIIEVIMFIFIYGVSFITLYSSRIDSSVFGIVGSIIIFAAVIVFFIFTRRMVR